MVQDTRDAEAVGRDLRSGHYIGSGWNLDSTICKEIVSEDERGGNSG